ncbi:MAG: hypothetical protein ACRDJG_12645, partial [Actinomycetota bacterium]
QTPSRVDSAVIDHIEEVLWRCKRQDDTLGPQAVFNAVLAQRNLVLAMQADASTDLRPQLLSVFGKLSEYVGWLSFDLHDFDEAQDYYEEALRAALEAKDAELAGFVLCDMSSLATWRGMARLGVDHAMAAREWAERTDSPLLGSYAADMAACAYAMNGEQGAYMEMHNAAHSKLNAATAQGERSRLLYFHGWGLLSSNESQCLLQFGEADKAAVAATQALMLIDGSFVRERALATVELGVAHVRARNVEEAANVLGDAIELAARNRSPRLMGRLRAARAEMHPWRSTRAVRDLDERLASYGLA